MKKLFSIILVIFMLLALCACGNTVLIAPTQAPTDAPTQAPTAAPTEALNPEPAPAPVSVTLYQGDDNAEYILPVECKLSELSPEAVVEELVKLGVFGEGVAVNSFSLSEGNVISLDLNDSFQKQIGNMGTAGEYIMLGSLVNSFLSAYGSDGMNLTIDGHYLETGHNIYDTTLIFYEA